MTSVSNTVILRCIQAPSDFAHFTVLQSSFKMVWSDFLPSIYTQTIRQSEKKCLELFLEANLLQIKNWNIFFR